MQVRYVIVDETNRKLTWYGDVERMPETQIPKLVINWKPTRRRKFGIPRSSWEEDINKIIQERNLGDDTWRDRQEWRTDMFLF